MRKLGFFDRLARRPARGAALFFWGVCTCRAGPMCPAAGYAFFGGARGPRPTGRYVEPRVGDGVFTVPSARQRRAVIARRAAPWQSVFLFWGDGFPRRCSHRLGMTGKGRTESSAPTEQNKNRAKGDVEDAVPYDFCAGRGGGGEALICL